VRKRLSFAKGEGVRVVGGGDKKMWGLWECWGGGFVCFVVLCLLVVCGFFRWLGGKPHLCKGTAIDDDCQKNLPNAGRSEKGKGNVSSGGGSSSRVTLWGRGGDGVSVKRLKRGRLP